MVMLPSIAPVALGANLTLMAQLSPAATLEPQVLVWVKSPLATMLEMVRAFSSSVFVSVTVWAVLLLPTTSFEKVRLVGNRLTSWARAEPAQTSEKKIKTERASRVRHMLPPWYLRVCQGRASRLC